MFCKYVSTTPSRAIASNSNRCALMKRIYQVVARDEIECSPPSTILTIWPHKKSISIQLKMTPSDPSIHSILCDWINVWRQPYQRQYLVLHLAQAHTHTHTPWPPISDGYGPLYGYGAQPHKKCNIHFDSKRVSRWRCLITCCGHSTSIWFYIQSIRYVVVIITLPLLDARSFISI